MKNEYIKAVWFLTEVLTLIIVASFLEFSIFADFEMTSDQKSVAYLGSAVLVVLSWLHKIEWI